MPTKEDLGHVTMFRKAVKAVRKSDQAWRQFIRSLRCWGFIPSGQSDEPAEEEDTARRTSASTTESSRIQRAPWVLLLQQN